MHSLMKYIKCETEHMCGEVEAMLLKCCNMLVLLIKADRVIFEREQWQLPVYF